MNKQGVTLLNNASATGEWTPWLGGRLMFAVTASSWGGGTVSLEYLLPDGTAINVGSETVLTENGVGGVELPSGKIRAVVDTATGVNAWALATGLGG